MRILAVAPEYPWPVVDGHKLRVYNLLRHLGDRSRFDLLCLGDVGSVPGGAQRQTRLGPGCRSVSLVPSATLRPIPKRGWVSRVANVFSPHLTSIGVPYFSEELAEAVRSRVESGEYDLALFWGLTVAQYLGAPTTPVPLVVDVVDSPSRLTWSYFASEPSLRGKGRRLVQFVWARRYEAKHVSRLQHLILISEADAAFMRRSCGTSMIWVVPNGVDTEYFSPDPGSDGARDTLLFTGVMDYWPNEEAMRFFLQDVLPRIRREAPGTKLVVAGRNPSAALRELAARLGGIELTGFVEDLRPCFQRAAAYVAPIRSGAGMKNKILEAWAMGVPVVATTEACRGIDVEDGGNLLVADRPEDLAAQALRLLREPALGRRLRESARSWVRERYSWGASARALEGIFDEVAGRRALP